MNVRDEVAALRARTDRIDPRDSIRSGTAWPRVGPWI